MYMLTDEYDDNWSPSCHATGPQKMKMTTPAANNRTADDQRRDPWAASYRTRHAVPRTRYVLCDESM